MKNEALNILLMDDVKIAFKKMYSFCKTTGPSEVFSWAKQIVISKMCEKP